MSAIFRSRQWRQRKTRLLTRAGFMANRYDFRYGEMNCNHWLRRFNHAATEFMLCRRLHKLCKQFAILESGLKIKKLGGTFSSLTLFIVDISLNHVLPYWKSAIFGHGRLINHYWVCSLVFLWRHCTKNNKLIVFQISEHLAYIVVNRALNMWPVIYLNRTVSG